MKLLGAIGLMALLVLSTSPSAHAMSEGVKKLLTTALWGAAIGTAAGLITYPLHREFKGIFVGSSVGLYTGLGVGTFHLFHEADPQNPLAEKGAGDRIAPPPVMLTFRIAEF